MSAKAEEKRQADKLNRLKRKTEKAAGNAKKTKATNGSGTRPSTRPHACPPAHTPAHCLPARQHTPVSVPPPWNVILLPPPTTGRAEDDNEADDSSEEEGEESNPAPTPTVPIVPKKPTKLKQGALPALAHPHAHACIPVPPFAQRTRAHTPGHAILCAATLVMKIKIGPVEIGSAVIDSEAVLPKLLQENAGGRLVYVPPKQWPDLNMEGCGWVAKIMSVNKATGFTTLKFHDGVMLFGFDTVALFKPLS